MDSSLLPWAFVSFYEMKMRWKEKGAFYLFLMVWCWGTILFYTLMATKYVTYSYISVVPAITFAAFGALRIRMGEKLPSILGGLGLLILMAALLVSTFRLKEGNWLVFYAVLAYGLFAYLIRWKANQYKRLTIISAVTASAFLCCISEGLPHFMMTRSAFEIDSAIQEEKGKHYFFLTYPASYSYYTGDIATRLLPDETLLDQEKRDARWDKKSPIPTVNEEQFIEAAKASDKPSYLYVANGKAKFFDTWSLAPRFEKVESTKAGTIYRFVGTGD